MFFNISYLYSFDAINLQKLPFFHNRAAELELLYYSVILTFSRKNGTPAGAARFHPFFSSVKASRREYIVETVSMLYRRSGNMEIYKMGCDFFETNRKYLKVPEDFLLAIKTYDHCLPLYLSPAAPC